MFATMYNTAARVSEIISLRQSDVDLNHKMTLNLHGKGRKKRIIPLWKNTQFYLENGSLKLNVLLELLKGIAVFFR